MSQEEFEKMLKETIKAKIILSVCGAMIIDRIWNGNDRSADTNTLIDLAREIM